MTIDLNADVGEGMDDAALLPLLTSVNVACGMHAGSPVIMDRTVALAVERGVRVGAHPGYADRENFGRLDLQLSHDEVRALVLYQVAALDGFARARGGSLSHVKAHGALYNRAAKDVAVARAVAEGVRRFSRDLVADRRYLPDGSLMPRWQQGAVLHDPVEAAAQAVSVARDGIVVASDGSRLAVSAQTLCLHGDTPGASEIARAVRAALSAAGVGVAPLA